ncbi:enoyl-CoA hydratase/isomerase family protein [Endozoicomonas atrinae]|uniref:enoyl-CoA hydratase/isomerase family protein n=1 Tax=Endozoicomonas atrinae TaxID=1333660 RepID=UPI000824F56C|nr:enoyl-CoA hydratase/isomerase family protein [Endozoicomonas atrinae]
MNYKNLILDIETLSGQSSKIATLCLNRPETGNALNEALIAEMHQALDQIEQMPTRLLILKSNGKHFCTGADLNWMKQSKALSKEENHQDAQQLARLIQRLDQFPAPTIAVIQGAAFGGALGLISACDIAIASKSVKFCLSEVKLGLIPAVISPYVVRAMGARQARRYFLSAETISSKQALRLNLIHERCKEQDLSSTVEALCHQILQNAPVAMAEAKQLIDDVSNQPIDENLIDLTCDRIASIRTSPEGQEGLSAFLEKRTPGWREPSANRKPSTGEQHHD